MQEADESGSIVTILCDSGERYAHSYYSPEWYVQQGIDTHAGDALLETLVNGAALPQLPVREP